MSEYPRRRCPARALPSRPPPMRRASTAARRTTSPAWSDRLLRQVADLAVRPHRGGVRLRRPGVRRVGGPGRHRRSRAQVKRTNLRRYLAFLTTREYARRSVARKAAALRRYFAWLVRAGHLDADPTVGLQARGGDGRLPRVLERRDLDELLEGALPRGRAGLASSPRRRGARGAVRLGTAGQRAVRARTRRRIDLAALGRRRVGQGRQGAAGAAVGPGGGGAAALAGRAPRGASATTCPRRAPAASAVRQRAGSPADPTRRAPDRRPPVTVADPSARAAPQLRHPPARRRRRPAGRAGAARPRRRSSTTQRYTHVSRERLRATALTRRASESDDGAGHGAPAVRRHSDRHEHRRRRPVPGAAVGPLAQAAQLVGPRPPDRVLRPARQVRRRPRRRRAPVERRSRRPRQLRRARADRRHRALRSPARREVRDVRHAAHPGGDLRRAARARLGAAVGALAGTRGRAGDRRARGPPRPVADRRRAGRAPPDHPRPAQPVAVVDRLDHGRPAGAGARRRRRAAGAERRGADRAVGRGRGARGPRR